MQKFAILLGGPIQVTDRLRQQVRGCRVIAADSGMAHAENLGLQPELWVGDFDSADAALQARHAAIARKVFPAAKDSTDGELAVREAVRRGAKELVLVGGFGGQFDHVLAHALQLLHLTAQGLTVMMTSGDEEAYPLRHNLALRGLAPGTRLSVLPLSELARLTITGVRWPLTAHDVAFASTLTLSNEAAGDVELSLASGTALVLVYPR
jgi:thiamine pyrophosphokinase